MNASAKKQRSTAVNNGKLAIQIHDDLVPLGDAEFRYIADMLYTRFGIHLSDQKRILVAGRLTKRLRQLGFSSFKTYIEYLDADTSGSELSELINRITTNHTFFFREREHFDFLEKTVLPGIAKQAGPGYPLRIWSAGCASGEEVYSTAMLLRSYYEQGGNIPDIGLLATDISLEALNNAQTGIYANARLEELPEKYRTKWFTRSGTDSWSIHPEIKKMVLFKRLNLMADRYPMKGQFDVIFCRNVMIYFDQDSRERVVNSLFAYLKTGGYLFIGHSESLRRDTCPFEYIKPAIYRKGA